MLSCLAETRFYRPPAKEVRELSNGSIAIMPLDHFKDEGASWERFKTVRDACKGHLDCDAFLDPSPSCRTAV